MTEFTTSALELPEAISRPIEVTDPCTPLLATVSADYVSLQCSSLINEMHAKFKGSAFYDGKNGVAQGKCSRLIWQTF